MQAGEILISGIFNSSRFLEVPFFQRAYVWGEPQWERFLSDMEFVTQTGRQYFLGSVILKSGEKPPTWASYSDHKIIIDGQQRLTTLMIFMKVLCLKENKNSLFDRDFRLEDNAIAIQHGKNDAVAFKMVADRETPEPIPAPDPPSRIIGAYNYFLEKLDPAKINRSILRQNLQFVCIDLLDNEDEQQVFDTINSEGVKLTTAEFLKNYFYHKDNVQDFEDNWVPVFEKNDDEKVYWDQELETGRMRRPLVDIFFDAYFQLFLQDKTFNVSNLDKIAYSRLEHLAKSYQEFIKVYCGGDKNVVLGPMCEYAQCFAQTFRPELRRAALPSKSGIERINVIIFGLQTTTLIPYVLYVARNVTDPDERNRIYGVLESYVMRRLVAHATTKNYNHLFESLILNNVTDAQTLKDRLSRDNDVTTYVPGDAELLEGFQTSKLINLQAKGILYFIESGIQPDNASTVLHGFDKYSLEHLMPKKWRNHWAPCATDALAIERDSRLLTLGNLAIIPQALNASIRDSDWDTKKAGKDNQDGLNVCAAGLLTLQDALGKGHWDEAEIEGRAQWLFEKAKTLWPW